MKNMCCWNVCAIERNNLSNKFLKVSFDWADISSDEQMIKIFTCHNYDVIFLQHKL